MEHGTRNAYNYYQCRCKECRAANAEYAAMLKERLRKRPQDAPHGTVGGYVNYRCICQLCRDAFNADIRERYRRKRAA